MQTTIASLFPRPHPDFISQPWRKIGRRPGIKTTLQPRNGGFGLYVTCPRLRDKIWEWPEDKAIPLQCSPSPSLAIRLNSLQYGELRDKLQAPIRTARNIVIQQSLSDRFAAAFLDQVRRNGVYSLLPGSPVGSLALSSSLSLP